MQKIYKQNLPETIGEHLIERIKSGEWQLGERLPPIRNIAEELNVSASTAASAIKDLVRSGWLITRPGSGCFVNRDLKAILHARDENASSCGKEISTHPSPSQTLYFFIEADHATPVYACLYTQILCTLQKEIEPLNWHLKIYRYNDKQAIAQACSDPNSAGILYMPYTSNTFELNEEIQRQNLVLLDIMERFSGSRYVLPDNYKAGYEVGKYLYERGHRKLVFITAFPTEDFVQDSHFKVRYQGLSCYLSSISAPPIETIHWNLFRENGTRDVENLLNRLGHANAPTALIIAGQAMAMEICSFAASRLKNRMLKEMVSLITFRDATADATPDLSYAAPPPDVMAKEAVALLRQGQDPQFRRESVRILVGMHIVERGSVHSLTEKA